MLAALATPSQLENGIPGGIDDEDRAKWVLDHVSAWARSLAHRDWLTTSPPDGVVSVVLLASRRLYQNPNFVVRWNEGPLGETFSEKSVPDGVFNPAELAILERVWRKKGMWVKNFARDDEKTSIGYLETVPAGKLMPVWAPNEPGWLESIHD